MATYVRAGLPEVAAALAILTASLIRWRPGPLSLASPVPVRRGHAAKKVLRTGAPLLLLLGEPGDGSRGYGADLACRGPGPDDDVYERLLAFGDEELRNYKIRLTLRSFEPTVAHEIAHLMSLISPKPLRMVLTEQDIQYASQIEAFD